jgi:SAM-dependent methyltransferase
MPAALEFTGERFIPGAVGEIAYEHWHRYAYARRYAAGRRVLDAACGEGYGTALLAEVAAETTGIDIDRVTVAHARDAYGLGAKPRFITGSVTALPFPSASFDVVVSFETIEHLNAGDQPRMLGEFARVLSAEGLLVLSSPNRRSYSDRRGYRNPFHRHELDREQLARLLDADFPQRRWLHQRPLAASAIWRDGPAARDEDCEAWLGDAGRVAPMTVDDGVYDIVVAAASQAALSPAPPRVSLYCDREESERARALHDAAEVLRLDALLKERDAALDRQSAHVAHLERLVVARERVVEERDAQLLAVDAARASFEQSLIAAQKVRATIEQGLGDARAALMDSRAALDESGAALARSERELAKAHATIAKFAAERERLEAALQAQERVIAYQRSLRGWLRLPWSRARQAWRR